MSANIDRVIERVLESEGGIADVGDGKGLTRFGQTPQWLEDNGFIAPTTVAQAYANYETWIQREGLDVVCEASPGLGEIVIDYAVHSGLVRAVKAMQTALGVTADGAIGPLTTAALHRADPAVIAKEVLADRVRLIGDLLASTRVDRRQWARGWCHRLARQVVRLP
jgi:lysozyme family protein